MADSRRTKMNDAVFKQLSKYCVKDIISFERECRTMLNGWPGIFSPHRGKVYGVGTKYAIPPLELAMAQHFQAIDNILYKKEIPVQDIPELGANMLALSSEMGSYLEESKLLLTHYGIYDEIWGFRNSIGFMGQYLQDYTKTILEQTQGVGVPQAQSARNW